MRTASTLLALTLLATGCTEYDLKSQIEPEVEAKEDPPVSVIGTPDIEVNPTYLDFGMLPKQCLSNIQPVTVKNVGDGPLDISDIRIVGSDKTAFRLRGDGSRTLSPGESFRFEVGFSPDTASMLGVNVAIDSNDPDEPTIDVEAEGSGTNDMTVEELFNQKVHSKADILWVVDNSGSMSGEVAALGQVFDVFINQFVNLGLDYQIGVITTDMDNPGQSGKLLGPIIHPGMANPVAQFNSQVNQGSSGSGNEQAFEAANAALSAPLINNENGGLVRPDANLSIITITDEEEGSDSFSANQMINWLDNYQGDPALSSFSAIAGPERTGLLTMPCVSFTTGADAEPTKSYPKVVRATGGVHANICQMNMTTVLQMLGAVASGLRTKFQLQFDAVESSIVVEVDGMSVPQDANNGWTYDPQSHSVVFNGNMVPPPGTHVDVTYETATPCD